MFKHFMCTFSSFSISDFNHGFHVVDAYSSPGLTTVLYKIVTFIGVKLVKHRFIMPIF